MAIVPSASPCPPSDVRWMSPLVADGICDVQRPITYHFVVVRSRRPLHLDLDPRSRRRRRGPARDELRQAETGAVDRRRPRVVVVGGRLRCRFERIVVRVRPRGRPERDCAVADGDRLGAVERAGGEIGSRRPAAVADRLVHSRLLRRRAVSDHECGQRARDDDEPNDDAVLHQIPLLILVPPRTADAITTVTFCPGRVRT